MMLPWFYWLSSTSATLCEGNQGNHRCVNPKASSCHAMHAAEHTWKVVRLCWTWSLGQCEECIDRETTSPIRHVGFVNLKLTTSSQQIPAGICSESMLAGCLFPSWQTYTSNHKCPRRDILQMRNEGNLVNVLNLRLIFVLSLTWSEFMHWGNVCFLAKLMRRMHVIMRPNISFLKFQKEWFNDDDSHTAAQWNVRKFTFNCVYLLK